jgi:hypothetical protein
MLFNKVKNRGVAYMQKGILEFYNIRRGQMGT